MLRFAFWSLLALNGALFAYGQGYLGAGGEEHEPARLKRQFNTPKLVLLDAGQAAAPAAVPADARDVAATPEQARAPAPAGSGAATATAPAASAGATLAAAAPTVAPAAAPAPPPAPRALACLDVGTLNAAQAKRFEARLAALDLGDRLPGARRETQEQEITNWLVHIPPQGSKEAAERKAGELRELGVGGDFYIIQGDTPMRYAISLGMFKTESGAQTLLANLNKQGVHSARILPRGPQSTRYSYRLRNLDEATRKRLANYAERFDGAEARSCGQG
ncbi:SPOR domain-containing protein [Massilia forsythiae]|uniref:SPOR domain-containing protein n=1 Tax=Massilia forsythiae TaxID=2728020 RepID=UPI001E60BF72|nr:SPOR domain-containing protein [Massilia forsythiae]